MEGHAKTHEGIAKENNKNTVVACLGVVVDDYYKFSLIPDDVQGQGLVEGI